jgi:hypothetical protein
MKKLLQNFAVRKSIILLFILFPCLAGAHIGSPNVIFEGKAGLYPVHVVIRPPQVIPGLAEISVRVEGGPIKQVTALPIKWNAGRKGAPPPDVAELVRGETNLHNAQLWFMESGSQSVEIEVQGVSGNKGRVTVPVDAVAMRVLTMPKMLGSILGGLGLILSLLLLSIIGAGVRESVVSPGEKPTQKRKWTARAAVATASALLVLIIWGGKRWWDAEAADYRNNRLYQPMSATATVRSEGNSRLLKLEVTDPRFARGSPIMPDHGKLMHMFLVQESKLETFAHLHPVRRDRKTFEARLPNLPEGTYRLYADVTYETGFSDTLTTTVELPSTDTSSEQVGTTLGLDGDDSWRIAWPFGDKMATRDCVLSDAYTMVRAVPERYEINRPVHLRFNVRQADNKPVRLEPYLGMRGHVALRRDDGSVFTHLHPGGTPSMASIQLSVLRAEGKLPLTAAFGKDDPVCQLPALTPTQENWLDGAESTDEAVVSFPYAFPKPGRYRLWVQVKIEGKVFTGVYDVEAFDAQNVEVVAR